MAELATIARPYAEAFFKAVGQGDTARSAEQLAAVAAVAADPQLRGLADNPKTRSQQVYDVIAAVVATPLSAPLGNLLRAMIDNGRLSALPEVARQFHALASAKSGVSDAVIYSAFEIDEAQLKTVLATLEKRFDRKLNGRVQLAPELIGGIRVVVGDEVLDTSVKARLEQMKAALTA